jgi:signal transduction histidine kinase
LSPTSDTSATISAIVDINSRLDMPGVLARVAEAAARLTRAPAAAISALDSRGLANRFVCHTTDDALRDAVASLENPHGLIELLPVDSPFLLPDDDAAPSSPAATFREAHPEVRALLGMPVRVGGRVFGHLYAINKPGGFDSIDAHYAAALARASATSIANAQIHEATARRERWLAAGQEITTMMLSGADEEDALALIAQRAREAGRADTCVLVLPSLEERLVIEIADGPGADDLVGTVMPREGRSHTVLTEGMGMIVDSFAQAYTLRVPQLREYGPALYAPMRTGTRGVGVILLLRPAGGEPFEGADLTNAESFASQAAVVLVLAEARHADDVKSLLDERERIARDLHDLAIQQLFATGMRLESARREVAQGASAAAIEETLTTSLDNVDDSVRQIRSIIHNLRDPDADVSLAERLRREASLSRAGLGFAPSLVIEVNGEVLDSESGPDLEDLLDSLVGADMSDDVVAVAREGLANAARHAEASSVQVSIVAISPGAPHAPPGGRIAVQVADDGVGQVADEPHRSGLANLQARARRHRGTFQVNSAPGQGTKIMWQAPLAKLTGSRSAS